MNTVSHLLFNEPWGEQSIRTSDIYAPATGAVTGQARLAGTRTRLR